MRELKFISKIYNPLTLEVIEVIYKNPEINQKSIIPFLSKTVTPARISQICKFLVEAKILNRQKKGAKNILTITPENYTELKIFLETIKKFIDGN